MKVRFSILLGLLLICNIVFSQTSTIDLQTKTSASEYDKVLENKIRNYKIVQLDYQQYLAKASKMEYFDSFELVVDDQELWEMQLLPQHHLTENMRIYSASSGYHDQTLEVYPYAGYLKGNSTTEVRLTFGKKFIYGFWQGKNNNRFIEPLSNVIPGANADLYIVYNGDDVIFTDTDFCASSHLHAKTNSMQNVQKMSSVGLCYEVDISTASDFSIYQKYGSNIADVTNHNVGVMNNVQMNYDDEFADELQFLLNEQWISDCATCDPWSATTDASALLSSFRMWANGSPPGFDEIHDIGQLWTDRDIAQDGNSGTVGIAYVGVVCGNFRYQVLEDFTSNANFLRVMVAHETGHNFDAVSSSSTGHDAPGSSWIMAPSVSNVSAWSPASISDIESYYNGVSCMAACAPPLPPVAAFSSTLTEICPGTTVQFFDQSTASPTEWSWVFVGGNPSTSTDESPTVTYSSPGVYQVSLTATNGVGSNTVSVPGYITVSSSGTDVVLADDFSTGLSNWTVSNADNLITWDVINVPGSSGESTAAWINNFDYNNGVGDLDGLASAVLDLSGRTNTTLQLEYSYARYNSSNSDIFRIKISTNGGSTFPNTVFTGQENGSGSFATVTDQIEAFAPVNSSEWCVESTFSSGCIEVDLGAFDGQNIVVLLENESDFGNNLYLDNILITSSCQVLNPPSVLFTSNVTEGCSPLTVQYQDLSGNNPDSWSWSFPGGNPSSSTQPNPLVFYETQGVFDVSLTVSNSAGSETDTYQSYIEVNDVPAASFGSSISNNTVVFTNTSVGGNAYAWDFGDGQASTDANPVHLYDEDGDYLVTLTVLNECGTSVSSQVITIATLPVANFSATNSEGCIPLTIQYVNESSTNSDTYLWTFDGGSPASSTDENPVVVYGTAGVFDVSLVVTNEQGAGSHIEESFVVTTDVPDVSYSAFQDGFTISFTNETAGGDSYLWEFGDGNSSSLENPTHTYLQDGVYTVTLTVTNACGSNSGSDMITISNLPSAGFTASSTAGCTPFTIQFSDASSSNVDSWNWAFDGGSPATSTEQNPVVVYNTVGVFDVSLIVSNEEGSDNLLLSDYVTVGDGPNSDFDFTANQLTYSFSSSSSNAISYLWEFGDNSTSNLENPNHTYAEDGSYTVRLTAINDCGSDISEMVIQVVSAVQAGMNFSATSGCADFEVQFSDNSSSNATSWFWTFEGGSPSTSTAQNPSVIFQSAGIYDVSLEVSNSGFTDLITQTDLIVVEDVPNADFSFDVSNLTVSFSNMTENGNSYIWNFGDTGSSSLANPSHTYPVEGVYQVMLIATNECGSDTSIVEVNVSSLPTANFSASSTSGCTDFTVNFQDLSTSSTTSWFWEFEGGNPATSTAQNPVVVYENGGSFDVKLTVSNGVGSDDFVLLDYIVVSEFPNAVISNEISGITGNFSFESDNYDSNIWVIEGITGTFDTPEVSVEFPADGDYEVKLTLSNSCGALTFIEIVTVTAYPDAAVDYNEHLLCAPAEIQFFDMSLDGVDSWEWVFEGGSPSTSTEQNPVVTYSSSGTYDVQLSVGNAFGSDITQIENAIVVGEEAIANFEFSIAQNSVDFTNSSNVSGDVLWDFGDSGTSIEQNPSHVYDALGTYEVTLILDAGSNCKDTITQTVEILMVDIQETYDFSCKVYPVPARDRFFVEVTTAYNKDMQLNLINALGQIVESRSISVQSGINKVEFQNSYPKGLYLMSVFSGEDRYLLKLIIN